MSDHWLSTSDWRQSFWIKFCSISNQAQLWPDLLWRWELSYPLKTLKSCLGMTADSSSGSAAESETASLLSSIVPHSSMLSIRCSHHLWRSGGDHKQETQATGHWLLVTDKFTGHYSSVAECSVYSESWRPSLSVHRVPASSYSVYRICEYRIIFIKWDVLLPLINYDSCPAVKWPYYIQITLDSFMIPLAAMRVIGCEIAHFV